MIIRLPGAKQVCVYKGFCCHNYFHLYFLFAANCKVQASIENQSRTFPLPLLKYNLEKS